MGHPLQLELQRQERTASWLAKKAGKSPSYVTRVILGQRRPSEEFKERAAQVLGVPIEQLFVPDRRTDQA